MTIPLRTEEWEKEFDDRFRHSFIWEDAENNRFSQVHGIKDFIHATLLKDREALISFIRGEVGGMMYDCEFCGENPSSDCYKANQNEAFGKVLKLVQSLSEQDTK